MDPKPVSPEHVAWWFETPGSEPVATNIRPPAGMTGVGTVQAVVTTDPDSGLQHVHIPWQPDPDDIAHLASGGTLWVSCIGGVAPMSVAVQPPETAQAWPGRVIRTGQTGGGRALAVAVELTGRRFPPADGTPVVIVAQGAPGGPDAVPTPGPIVP